jgi:hypothetical protein
LRLASAKSIARESITPGVRMARFVDAVGTPSADGIQ